MPPTNPSQQSWNPALYDHRASFVALLGTDLAELLAPTPEDRILDLGCGTGTLTAALAARGAEVVGLDASAAMIDEARRKHPKLVFCVGDAQDLAYDAEFDAVFSNAALHWMLRAEDTARGIARALKPGGRFVAELGGAGNVQLIRHALSGALVELGEAAERWMPWYFPTLAAYAGVLEQAGLTPKAMTLFERPTPVQGDDGLAVWLRTFAAPLLAHLGDRAPALEAAVTARCRATLYRNGAWHLDYVRLRVLATRPTA